MNTNYKYVLKWSGTDDSPKVRAAFKNLESFHMWNVVELIDHARFQELIESEQIENPKDSYLSSWTILPGQVGLIADSHTASNYSNTWSEMSTSFSDFCRGWEAALQHV